jgi:LysR family glycine cleavage system transcriptional activator
MAEFYEQQPHIRLQIDAGADTSDRSLDAHELAIELAASDSRMWSAELTPVYAVPVCAPSLLDGTRLDSLSDIDKYPLIHVTDRLDPWSELAAQAGASWRGLRRTFCSNYGCMRACEQGLGLALGYLPTIQSWLDSGRVMLAANWACTTNAMYRVTSRTVDVDRLEVRLVVNWIQSWFPKFDASSQLCGLSLIAGRLTL